MVQVHIQVSGLCGAPVFSLNLPKRFTQFYRALYGDTILSVPTLDTNMTTGNQQRHRISLLR